MTSLQMRCFSFFKLFCQQTCSQKLEIPISYMESERRFPRKVLLRNRTMKVWNIEIAETKDGCFFKHGWAKFVEDNCFKNGDQLVFTYDDPSVFDFVVVDPSGCEKIIVHGKEARVIGLKKHGSSDDNFEDDNVVLVVHEVSILKEVKKDYDEEEEEEEMAAVKEEEEEEEEEEENNDGGYHKRSKKKIGGSKRSASARKRDVGAEETDVSEEKNEGIVKKKKEVPDHFGIEIFSTGRFTQPTNPYFVTKVRPKRRDDLYIPIEVIRDHNIQLPATVILRDPKGKEWTTYIKTWGDGRTWLSGGWRSLCRWNLVQESDRCICEFVPSLGPELVLQVTIIRRRELE